MSKLRQVAIMPRQSLTIMKVALGVRAQYATLAVLGLMMITQIIGVVIFSGKAQAYNGDPYDSRHNPYDLAITSTVASYDGASITVSGKIGGDSGQTITIKLDGQTKGTTQATVYDNNAWTWSYIITGVTGSGSKTVTAEVQGETLVSAELQTNLPTMLDFYANGTYEAWHYQYGTENRTRNFEVSPVAVEDTVHHKMYYISTNTLYPDIAIQDTQTRDFLAKLTPYQDDNLSPQDLLLGSSNEYVYVVSYLYDDDRYAISKLSTVSNQITSTVELTGNEAEAACSGGYFASGPTADSARALSLDESILYVRRCGHVDMYDTATGAFIDHLNSGDEEAINGSLVLSPDGTRLYSYAGNKVFAYDTLTHAVVGSYTDAQVCTYGDRRVRDIALTPDGSKLYVTCWQSTVDDLDTYRLYAINTVDWSVILGDNDGPIVTSGAEAFSNMVFSPDGTKLYVGAAPVAVLHSPVYIKIVDTTNQEVTSSPAADSYSYIVFSKEHNQILLPDSHPYSNVYDRGQIWDLDSNLIFDNILDVPNTLSDTGVYTDTGLHKKYVTDGYHNLQISDIVSADPGGADLVEVGNNPRGVVVDYTGTYAYVANMGDGTISQVSVANKTVVNTIQTDAYPYGIVMAADNSRIYVTHYYSDKVSVINTSNNSVINTVDVGANPTGLDVSPDGTRLYVTNSGDNTVSVIDTGSGTVVDTVAVGEQPLFIRVNRAGTKVFVANNGTGNDDTSISVITTSNNSVQNWSDSSFESLGANNIDVSLDDATVYLSTHSANMDDDGVMVVGINTDTGIDGDHPIKLMHNDSVMRNGHTDNSSPIYGFGKNIGAYTVTASAQVTVTVPNTDPLVTITSPSDGASFAHDNNTVTVTGTGPANQTIRFYMDGEQFGITSTNGSGNWQYVVSDVAVGGHVFDAQWIPGGDVAFIPYVDTTAQTTRVNIVNTEDDSVIRTIALPAGSFGIAATLNHAGTKAYVAGYSTTGLHPKLWEIDTSAGIVTHEFTSPSTGQMYMAPTITADDNYAYIAEHGFSGNPLNNVVRKIDLQAMSVVGDPINLGPTNFNGSPSFAVLSATFALTGNSLYSPIAITDDVDPQTISVINTINNSIQSPIVISQPRTSNVAPLVTEAGGKIYFATNNKLVELDPQTNTVTKEITLTSQDANTYMALAFAVDATHQKAYMVTALSMYIVDLATEAITHVTLPSPSAYPVVSVQLTSDVVAPRLYLVKMQGGVKIFDTVNQVFVSPQSEPIPTTGTMGYAIGDFMGPMAPPTATVNFTINAGDVVGPPEEPPVDQPPITNPEPETPEQPELPTVTDVTPAPQISKKEFEKAASLVFAPNATAQPQNSFLALAKRIPEPFAIGFPWLLLLLALILVSTQYYQVHAESASTKRLQQSVANQERLVDEQNNFVALSTHYLHTPLTVMEGEISLMVKAGTITEAQATKLKATLTSLNAEAEAVLAEEEQDK